MRARYDRRAAARSEGGRVQGPLLAAPLTRLGRPARKGLLWVESGHWRTAENRTWPGLLGGPAWGGEPLPPPGEV